MGILTNWHNDTHTILLFRFEATWTWDDLFASWELALDLLDAQPNKVDMIIDMTGSRKLPAYDFAAIKRLGEFPTSKQEGMTILVGADVFVQSLWNAYNHLYPSAAKKFGVRFVSTMDDAQQVIVDYTEETAGSP